MIAKWDKFGIKGDGKSAMSKIKS